MRRMKFVVLAASACALVACTPPGEQDSDQAAGTPSRGPIAGQQGSSTSRHDEQGGDTAAPDLAKLNKSGGRYNLISNHLVEGTVELRHDGKGTAAVTAKPFITGLADGSYELRGYAVSSCESIGPGTPDLATLGEMKVEGGNATVTAREGKVDPVEVLTIAAMKPGTAGAAGTEEVAACGPWIKWVGESADSTESATNGAG